FRLAMASCTIAGEIAGVQMGISAASLYDASSAASSSALSVFFGLFYSVVFLTLNGHHQILRTLSESFFVVGPFKAGLPPVGLFVAQAAEMTALGCKLAAPVAIPIMLMSLGTGLVSRIFPQANVISLNYGFAMLTGLALLAATLYSFDSFVADSIQSASR